MARIFVFGDDIDTDVLAPGRYMRGGIEGLAPHCLEAERPDFAAQVQSGDILVAGRNFGVGSSREQAAEVLKYLGLSAVVARSFAGIFYRNAINLGLPALVGPNLDGLSDGDTARLDLSKATLTTAGRTLELEPVPDNLQALLNDGGLVPHLRKRFASRTESEGP